ncbi:SIMPL domain-containing protein [Acidomonas methanolica]|uniref:SIMPL domain-containing protein n=1 Tax=Acidomonas methanolica TaxID=437 RepID=UPI002119FEC0|nr:SIMPL domain-containing protein [Acidomonas methanolica]MCQ9155055.1 SIMPL domain-containing protein [Acidomonas methanolica]
MKRSSLPVLLATLSLFWGGAWAAEETDTLLHLNATGRASAAPSLLTATFSAEASGADAAAAQARVNALTQQAEKRAAQIPSLKLLAQDYNVVQDGTKPAKPHWTASQTLSLSGTDSVAVLKLAGTMQADGLLLNDLRWSLDPQTRDALLRQAREDALRRLQADAADAAHTLGLHFKRFRTVHLVAPTEPRPMMMMTRMAAISAPQRSEEPQDVSIMATGEAILQP